MLKINKIILIAACFGMMSSCTILPRSGPNKYEVTASVRGENPTAHIVPVTPEVVYETKMSTSSTFTKSFLQAKPLNAELIRPGDTLNLKVWEKRVTSGWQRSYFCALRRAHQGRGPYARGYSPNSHASIARPNARSTG